MATRLEACYEIGWISRTGYCQDLELFARQMNHTLEVQSACQLIYRFISIYLLTYKSFLALLLLSFWAGLGFAADYRAPAPVAPFFGRLAIGMNAGINGIIERNVFISFNSLLLPDNIDWSLSPLRWQNSGRTVESERLYVLNYHEDIMST